MNSKALWQSKTLWLNLLAIAALIFQHYFGFVIDAETQVVLLGAINTGLRLITKQPLDWSKPGTGQQVNDGGFIACRLLPIMAFTWLIGLLFMVAACATLKKDSPEALATKSLLTIKETIVTTAVAGDALCKQGTLKPKVCADLAGYYQTAGPAYDIAADALETAIKVKSADGSWEKFQTALWQLNILYGGIMKLAGENGILTGGAQ